MPTYPTPEPILAVIEFSVGEARITATDRDDTVAEVRPSNPDDDEDIRAAEQTRIEYAAGRLLVKGPKQRSIFGKGGSIDVLVELPAASRLQAHCGMGAFRVDGPLGDSRVESGAGDIMIDQAGAVDVTTGAGAITVNEVSGSADVTTASGRVKLGHVTGRAVVKSSNGEIWIGEAIGDLRVRTANGRVDVDRAQSTVDASTANGDLRIGGLTEGRATLKTSMGGIEIGVQEGTAAKLDVHTQFGNVRNQLQSTDQPGPADHTVEVYARTSMGDITIRRTPGDLGGRTPGDLSRHTPDDPS
jgi:DUF4097 and DUF4098 domain-containing protein YvlB